MTRQNLRNEGPNQIILAANYHTSNPRNFVKLLAGPTEKFLPVSVPTLLQKTAKQYPHVVALCIKNQDGGWDKITYKEYEEQVQICAKAFIKLGLRRYHSVCIIGFNRPEWHISNLAAIYAGGFATGLYTTNSTDEWFSCLEETKANIIVLDLDQLEKVLEMYDKLKYLKAIILYGEEEDAESTINWIHLMEIGRRESNEDLENILKNIAINECASIVYTCGTSGNAKPIMLSHDNLTWVAVTVADTYNMPRGGYARIVSYLPLAHITNQIFDIYIPMAIAATVFFAFKDAFKGTLVSFLKQAKPTMFLGVPKVWEKMQKFADKHSSLQKKMANHAKVNAIEYYIDKIEGHNSHSLKHFVSNVLFRRVHAALGFSQCSLYLSHSATLSSEVKKFFMSINIPIMETYGTSETTGIHTLCTEDGFGLETKGRALYGTKTTVRSCDKRGVGQVYIFGRHLCMGYLQMQVKTNVAIDQDNLFNTGDVGYVDDRGFTYITGVLKDMLQIVSGEWIAPVEIEQRILHELPFMSNCMVVGQGMKYLTALVTMSTLFDMDTGLPLDTLTMESKLWLQGLLCTAETVSDVIRGGPNSSLLRYIKEQILGANAKVRSKSEIVEKIIILPHDFSIATGEFGPTMKLRRNIVYEHYKDIINIVHEGE